MVVPELDPITGRYVYVEAAGVRNRIYFEESGQGFEVLCGFSRGIAEARYGLRVYVVDRDFETTLEEAPAHGLPHVSQPDEAYLLHAPAVVSPRTIARGRTGEPVAPTNFSGVQRKSKR